MRRRLYCLLPDVAHCKHLVAALRNCGLSKRYIRVLARQDISLEGLPKAYLTQRSELAYGLKLGLGVGGVAGMMGGLLAVTFPPAGTTLAGGFLLLATTLAGAGFGGLVSALVASGIPNDKIGPFNTRIFKGEILVILDIPTDCIPMATQLIEGIYPNSDIGLTLA
ncbi:MAG: DUF1269 domain-containing protein [Gammaproteobacteria bacterium]|nr:DUF1269 domain-containing protein [Gammaproteobacteria bacterium]